MVVGVAAAALVVLAALLAFSAVTATPSVQEGTVVGRPVLELFAPDNRVLGGEQVTLEVFITNSGVLTSGGPATFEERVKTARNVRFSVDTDRLPEDVADDVEVLSGEVPAGTVPEGIAGPFGLRLEVSEDIPPGTYELPVRLSYDYTSVVRYSEFEEPRFTDISRDARATLTLVVRERARFAFAAEGPVVTAGETAVKRLTVTNVGSEPAGESVLLLSAANGSVTFGERGRARSTERVALGRLDPGESRTVPVRVGAPADLPPGAYPVTATVGYRSPAGVRERSTAVTVSVPVGAEQTFAVADASDTLRVGERGTVEGRVVNTGGRTVTNAVVVFPEDAAGLTARQPEYAVGSLAPGESAPFAFVVDVANDSTGGPRLLDFRVRYRDPGDEVRVSDAVDAPVTVSREQTFAVRDVAGDLRVAAGGTLTGTVLNTGDEPVTDAVVVFDQASGLTPRETRFPVGDLDPGESATFRFPVDVPATADPGPQFVGFRVRYRGQGDERRVSDPLDARVRVDPEQAFRVAVTDSTLRVGDTGRVRGRLVNTGNATVEGAALVLLANDTDLRPRESEFGVGSLDPGESVPFGFTVDVPRGAGAGPRQLRFQVRYRGRDDERRASRPLDARVPVAPEQAFRLQRVESDLRVGERGEVTATLVNAGDAPAEDVSLLYAANGSLQPLSAAAAAGTLEPSEGAPVAFTFDVPRTVDPGARPLTFRVRYRGQDGEFRTSAPLVASVGVAPEQTFALRNVTSTLRVDDTGQVTARLVNTGAVAAESVVLAVEPTAGTLIPRESEYAVGSLAPGENASVAFRFDVTADAEPGPRQVAFRVRYRGQADERQTTDPIDARVTVGPERDEFHVEAANATLPAGGSTVVDLRVESREDRPLRNVRARLFVDDPLASDDAEAFVPELGPNETATLRFALAADGGAVAKQYPLLVDFTYEDADGDTVLSDTYFVPVTVTEPPPRRLPVGVDSVGVGTFAVLVVAVALAGLVYWKRRAIRTGVDRLRR